MSLDHFHWNEGMPLARIGIGQDGALSVWVAGVPRQVPRDLLHQDRMGLLLDHLYLGQGGPYEVEIISPDGSVQTGLVDLQGVPEQPGFQQQTTYPPGDSPLGPPSESAMARPVPDDDVVVWEAGFIPGEPVAVAYIAGDMPATADGQPGMTIPREMIAGEAPTEMLLFGRQSGTTILCQPFRPR
jgi:hypothetical protein